MNSYVHGLFWVLFASAVEVEIVVVQLNLYLRVILLKNVFIKNRNNFDILKIF